MYVGDEISLFTEYDAIARLGIENPQEYLNRRYADHTKLLKLETCCVGHLVQTRVEAALEEVQSSNGWVDIMVSSLSIDTRSSFPLLPSPPHSFCDVHVTVMPMYMYLYRHKNEFLYIE